jgi:hypothetical protein
MVSLRIPIFLVNLSKIHLIMSLKRKSKSFDDWTAQDMRATFGLKEVPTLPILTNWLLPQHAPTPEQARFLESKRALLARFYRSWNEDELKFRFIAQVVELAELIGEGYNTFTQRKLSAVVKNTVLQGRPELMVAMGEEAPVEPYFFIHEYKPSKQSDDPLGQLLAAMVAAQAHNADKHPMLGCFVIGVLWQFVVLDDANYALSRTYDANQMDDLLNIYSALCEAKVYIEGRLRVDFFDK